MLYILDNDQENNCIILYESFSHANSFFKFIYFLETEFHFAQTRVRWYDLGSLQPPPPEFK